MSDIFTKLTQLREAALECPIEEMRVQYIDAANRLIGESQNAGEMSASEASDMRCQWVSAYACRRGLTLAAIDNGHVQ